MDIKIRSLDIPIDIMVPGYVPDTSQYDDIVVEWGNWYYRAAGVKGEKAYN